MILTVPPPSPILLPINGVLKQDPSCEASMQKDIVRSGVENIPPPQRVITHAIGLSYSLLALFTVVLFVYYALWLRSILAYFYG